MSATVCDQRFFATHQQGVFVYKKLKNFLTIQSTFTLPNIKAKTCSAPSEPSYATRPETKNNPGLKRISAVTQQCCCGRTRRVVFDSFKC